MLTITLILILHVAALITAVVTDLTFSSAAGIVSLTASGLALSMAMYALSDITKLIGALTLQTTEEKEDERD